MAIVTLPTPDRRLETYRTRGPRPWPTKPANAFNRSAIAAAHVVADPLAECDPWLDAPVDWDTTIAYRRHLWRLGLGVAEAMDTAQRGMGLDWKTSLELIRRSIEAARSESGAVVFSGAGTDHLPPGRHAIDETQELNYRFIAQTLADLGYKGYVAHEYRPSPGRDPIKSVETGMAILDV